MNIYKRMFYSKCMLICF